MIMPLRGVTNYGDEAEAQEWDLEVENYDELWEESSHQMAFFWNSLGLAVSMDDSKDSEKMLLYGKTLLPLHFIMISGGLWISCYFTFNEKVNLM